MIPRAGSRPELLHVLTLPDFDRADSIGSYRGTPRPDTFAELPIDCEEDRVLRAALVGTLREAESKRQGSHQWLLDESELRGRILVLAGSRVVQIQLDLVAFSKMTRRRG